MKKLARVTIEMSHDEICEYLTKALIEAGVIHSSADKCAISIRHCHDGASDLSDAHSIVLNFDIGDKDE